MSSTEEEVGSKESNYWWYERVPFFLSFTPSEQRRKRPFHDSSWCDNTIIISFNSFYLYLLFLSFPTLTSTHPVPHHIHTVSLWPTASIQASQKDRLTERRGLICTDKQKCFSMTFNDNLEWRNELQTYSKFIEMYTSKSYLYEVILSLWTENDFEIIDRDQVLIEFAVVLRKRGEGYIAERYNYPSKISGLQN